MNKKSSETLTELEGRLYDFVLRHFNPEEPGLRGEPWPLSGLDIRSNDGKWKMFVCYGEGFFGNRISVSSIVEVERSLPIKFPKEYLVAKKSLLHNLLLRIREKCRENEREFPSYIDEVAQCLRLLENIEKQEENNRAKAED